MASSSSSQLGELANLVLSSPKGVAAVVVAISSTIGLFYLFLFSSFFQAQSKCKSGSARASPTKQQSPTKKSPAKKAGPASSTKREAPSKPTSTGKTASTKSSPDKKSATPASNPEKKPTSAPKTAASKQKQPNGALKSSQNKDDGEWITVSSKKKVVRTKKSPAEAPSAPQTRMSTRRSNQNSQTLKRV